MEKREIKQKKEVKDSSRKLEKGYDMPKSAFKYPTNADVNKLNIPEGGFFG